MKHTTVRSIFRKSLSAGLALALAASAIPALPESVEAADSLNQQIPIMTKAGSISVSDDAVTYNEPFAAGTGGSQNFRIPALITLQNGSILATADARWETTGDGGGIDSIASVSEDGGKTWHYSFPLYFPDSYGYAGTAATTIIDPGVLEGPDGTVYFIADVNPTGGTTMNGYRKPGVGTGYINVDNEVDQGRYQAITMDWNTSCKVEPKDDDLQSYPYYIGDLNEEGYAEILNRSDGSSTGVGVDEWYNLYSCSDGEFSDDLEKSTVVNKSDMKIQQNAFYKDSLYHVFGNTDYLWVITSKDGGKTWEHPRDLTDQIKRNDKDAEMPRDRALLVSPGRGISTSCGDFAIGFYDNGSGDEENASIVYSTDNGKTWERTKDMQRTDDGGFWTSENEVVELEDGTLRMFARNGNGKICYADAKKDPETGKYEMEETSVKTDVDCTSACNVTAISYSKKINGKQAILVGCPTGGRRAKGKIFIFLVEPEDNTMTLYSEFAVPNAEGGYEYSCLTEMEDGTVALLWEPSKWPQVSMYFNKFSILEIAPDATIEGASMKVNLNKGETFTRTYSGEGDFLVTKEADKTIAEIITECEEDKKVITITGTGGGYTETIIDGMIYEIFVADSSIFLPADAEDYVFSNVSSEPKDITGNAVEVTYEPGEWSMFDHTSYENNSLKSFSDTVNSGIDISDAEFTFTASGTKYSIYNEKKNTYLKNTNINTFFQAGETNMTVTPVDGKFRICNADGERYVIFYTPQMNFNSNIAYSANYATGTFELDLLEKQDSVSEDDVIPGYKAVTSITSGNKYLIAHIMDEGNVIVLYPQNGADNQTKLFRKYGSVTITPKQAGEASVTVEGIKYYFVVTKAGCKHETTVIRGAAERGCLDDGYSGDTYCADCGTMLEKGEAIPAAGSHNWGEPECVKPVTETEDGEIVYTCLNNPNHKMTETVYAFVYQPLKEAYESASEIMEDLIFYQEEGVSDLKEVYGTCEKIINNQGAKSSSMIQATEALQNAIAALVPKTAAEIFQDMGSFVQDVESDYNAPHDGVSNKVWSNFETAYKRVKDMTDDTDIEDMKSAVKALVSAREALTEEKYNVASDNLKKGTESAKAIIAAGESKYTPETWKKFYDAYQAAVSVSASATESELKTLLQNLQAAQSALVFRTPQTDQTEKAQVGDSATISNVKYVVTDVTAKTAAVSGATKASIKILPTVMIKDETFTVTAINANAFKGSKTLKKVVIGANVTTIGKQAFANCKRLTSVTIGAKVKTIGKKAFYNSSKLKTIILKCKSIKKVDKTAFKKTAAKGVKVQMPKGLKKNKRQSLLKKLQTAGLSKKAKMK